MDKQKKFGNLYDKHVDEIYRFIFLKVSTREIAQDITAETFRKGWQAFKKNPKMDNPRAYLYRIARNLVIDHYRTKKQHITDQEIINELEDHSKDLQDKAAEAKEMAKIKEAMENLKDSYQDIIIYKYLEEMSNSEIARIMDKSEGAVRVTAHRAINALEKEVEKLKNED